MRSVYTHTFSVPESAIDVNGHVSNIEYVRWMQDAATAHTASEGWTLERYREHRAVWVVRTHTIEYLRPAFAGDRLELHTWIASVRDCQSRRKYLFNRAGEDRLLAKAETLWICIDPETGRPRRVPEEFIAAFDLVDSETEALGIVQRRCQRPNSTPG
ncbi:MAG: acyl-CoA thioesterase [Chlorobiaceae bacterium]|nr:acyl-CoA thioesterase [Chlorobiaceae bacterium]NTW74448.1 acyl-CoA thioesterase [Chlorobiaceae bacterium]